MESSPVASDTLTECGAKGACIWHNYVECKKEFLLLQCYLIINCSVHCAPTMNYRCTEFSLLWINTSKLLSPISQRAVQ